MKSHKSNYSCKIVYNDKSMNNTKNINREEESFNYKEFDLEIHSENDNCIRYVKKGNGLWFEVFEFKGKDKFTVSIEDKNTGWFFYLLKQVNKETMLKQLIRYSSINILNECEAREGDRLQDYDGNEYLYLDGKMVPDIGSDYEGQPVVIIANKFMEEEGYKRKIKWVDRTSFSYPSSEV